MAGFACISRCRTHQLVACPCKNHSQSVSSSRRRGGMTLKHTHCLCGFADTAAYQKVSDPKFVQPERERLLKVAETGTHWFVDLFQTETRGWWWVESSRRGFPFQEIQSGTLGRRCLALVRVEYPGRTDVRAAAVASRPGLFVAPHLDVQVSGLGMVVDSSP